MGISFICSNVECGKALSAPDTAAGKKVRCPKCGAVTVIPSSAAPAGPASSPPSGGSPFEAAPTGSPFEAAPGASPFAVAGPAAAGARKKGKPPKAKKPKSAAPGIGYEFSGVAIKFGIAVVLIAAVGGGIWALCTVLKLGGQAVESEGKAVFGAKHAAEETVAENYLGMIRDAIKRYEIENERYPSSLHELVEKRELPEGALRPGKDLPDYAYIPQRPDAPDDCVLVYEEKPIPHQERCNVLLHSGEMVMMTPEALATALEKTKSRVDENGGPESQ